ncbi:MAG: hypothetical protein QOG64_2941 [Acidimicrobiaceae bacterium]|nr:hypothetical protein [Acidimicrobiaceae bacterium]
MMGQRLPARHQASASGSGIRIRIRIRIRIGIGIGIGIGIERGNATAPSSFRNVGLLPSNS